MEPGSVVPMSVLSGAHTQYSLLAESCVVVLPQQVLLQVVASAHGVPLAEHLQVRGVREGDADAQSGSPSCIHQSYESRGTPSLLPPAITHVPQMKLSPYLVAVEQHLAPGSVVPMSALSAAHLLGVRQCTAL